ncbi:MAG: hypothetical protein ACM3OB_08585 [Acidobacteriota bacterium]
MRRSILLLAALIAVPAAGTADSNRSHVLLRYECDNEIARREITLFGNGTIRVRDGLKSAPSMTLGELGPDDLAAIVARLRAEDLSEVGVRQRGVSGPWVERCVIELDVGNPSGRQAFGFGHYDSLPLPLAHLRDVAEDLASRVDPSSRLEHLSPDYVPRPGDILKRVDGVLYEIIGPTADKRGLELQGVSAPLTLFIPKDALSREFVALVARRGRTGDLVPVEPDTEP